MSTTILPADVRLRPIALPMEHGGWGFLFEPILLGLALAPSGRGVALAVAAIASFLVRQPLKILWSDFVADRKSPRTGIAIAFAAAYAAIALLSLATAFYGAFQSVAPLLFAGPLVLTLLWYDAKGKSREIVPELGAPVALASVGASIAMLGGWTLPAAAAVWALLALRAVPTVLYVRSRLRLEHRRATNLALPLAAHAASISAALGLSSLGLAPFSALPLYGVLLLRAGVGLSTLRQKASARSVGFSEIGWGALAVLWLTLAFRLG